MRKYLQLALGLVSLVVIAVLGWAFFRVNMAVHPMMRSCFVELAGLHKGYTTVLLRSGSFVVDERGSRVVLDCELKDAEGKASEASWSFPLEQDPARPAALPGGNPFEDPAFLIVSMENAAGTRVPLGSPIHAAPTPALIHVPLGVVERVIEGRPTGPQSSTFYDRRLKFFRYTDRGATPK